MSTTITGVVTNGIVVAESEIVLGQGILAHGCFTVT